MPKPNETLEKQRTRAHAGVSIPKVLYQELESMARDDARSVSGLVTKVMGDFVRDRKRELSAQSASA